MAFGAIRAGVLLLFAAGLVGPCLSSCLAPRAQAKSHACCQQRPGTDAAFAAPAKDCCASEDQVTRAGTALHAPAVMAAPFLWAATEHASYDALPPTVRAFVSPPLVLRI